MNKIHAMNIYKVRNKNLTSGSSSLRLDAQTARATYPSR